MTMWMRSFVIALAALLLAVTTVAAGDREVTVMTRNVYHGVDAELNAVIADPANLLTRVSDVYLGYHTRIFPARAQALADEIAATRPDLIGLQEAVKVRVDPIPDGPVSPAEVVVLDFVKILLDALETRGLHYERVVVAPNFDAELPASLGFDVRHSDREVILARRDPTIKLSNAQGGRFAVNCTVPFGPGSITIHRGWASVDVKVRGRHLRFISTHLDVGCPIGGFAVQVAQAQELLDGPASTSLPVILVGDLNSSPVRPLPSAYDTLAGAGFADAWLLAGAGDGFTCCQDAALLNPVPQFTERVDLVLVRGHLDVDGVQVVGGMKAASGVWASDHAGVVATIERHR